MDKSNKQISMTEHLSALLDDEAGTFEQRRVLDELKSSDELCKKLSSYALIGETMRSASSDKPAINAGAGFLAGIHKQIEAEDEYHDVQLLQNQQQSEKSKSWLRPVGGFALAASVAAIAVLGVQNYQLSNNLQMIASSNELNQNADKREQLAQADVNTTPVVTTANAGTDTEQYAQASLQARSLLKRYVDSHMQYASNTTFVPSVRVIAYADYK